MTLDDRIKPQMELAFERASSVRRETHHQRRLRRAHWWFSQMRQAVDRALVRHGAPAPPPQQIYLPIGRSPMMD